MWHSASVLILDDNSSRREEFSALLRGLGEPTQGAEHSAWSECKAALNGAEPSAKLLILGQQAEEGALDEMLTELQGCSHTLPVALLSDSELEIEAPANEQVIATFTELPHYQKLLTTLHLAARYRQAQDLRRRAPAAAPRVPLFRTLVGASAQVNEVRAMMAQVADKEVSVLITGQSGTGKEVVARNLHQASNRKDKPFVPVNCGAIAAELLESELFGHEKGAFTGAISTRAGRFEMAEGGTLFLDEIGDMPLNMQVKILRVLQERCYERVGGNKTLSTDVRIIAATHRDLEAMIEAGTFREDLYYRLNVFPIEMPSLSERTEDIPLLINELVARMEKEKRGSTRFNSTAILSLCQHPWSGNVRELANLVERMAIMHPQGVVGLQELPLKYQHIDVESDVLDEAQSEPQADPVGNPSVASMSDVALLPEAGIDLKEYLTKLEKNLIQQALDDAGGIVARAAERLNIRRTTLVEKMRKYELQRA